MKENEQLLSPEAKATFAVYEKHVKAAQGSKTGSLGLKEFMKMQGEMAKVGRAAQPGRARWAPRSTRWRRATRSPAPSRARELTAAILKGAGDVDNQAAGAEFKDVAKFVKENAQLLSPEAKKAFAVYQQYAAAAQAKGQTGIGAFDFARMGMQMQRAGAPHLRRQERG